MIRTVGDMALAGFVEIDQRGAVDGGQEHQLVQRPTRLAS